MNGPSPYKGLSPFEDSELDALFFFGRSREQAIITANLTAARLTLLYGPSGVGKSSVLRAGVARRLRQLPGPLAVVVFDRWREDPGGGLRAAVAGAAGERPKGSLADTLEATCASLGGELYVILDGAEEYFVYHGAENEPGTFAADFPAAVTRPGLRAYFLLSLREDALAGLDRFKPGIPSLFANSLRLDHLDREAAREAIVGPIEQYNLLTPGERVEIEPELVEAVLDEVATGKVDLGRAGRGAVNGGAGGVHVETPYLSLVMERLWEVKRSTGSSVLRLRALEELGGADQIVRDHLDNALATLSPASQDAAAEVFTHLVTPSGTKIAHAASDLADYAGVREGELEPVLQTLASERILRPVAGTNGSSRYEIFHDVLAGAVLAWRSGYAANRELERERLAARRRMRRLLVAVAVALVAVLAMAAVAVFALAQRSDALHQRSAARVEARHALARALRADAVTQLQLDPELSLLLAVEAARREPTPAVADALRKALEASHVRAVIPVGPKPVVAFSPNSELLAVGDGDGAVRIFTVRGKRVRVLRRRGGAVTSVSFSTNGNRLISASKDNTARIWRAADGKQLKVLRHNADVLSASFSPDGSVLTTAADGIARIWRRDDGKALPLAGEGGRLVASFSRDGSKVVTASTGTPIAHVSDARTGALLYPLVWHEHALTSAAFSPDGTLVLTGSEDGTARLWRKGKPVLERHQNTSVVNVVFSPKGDMFLTGRRNGAVVIWNTETGDKVAVAGGHAGPITDASFSPDDLWVVTSSTDPTARVYKADNPLRQTALLGHKRGVTNVSFSANDRFVATASDDGTARVWDPDMAPQLRKIARTGGRVNRVAFSPDGRLFIAASDDGTARIWRSGTRVATLHHRGPVTDASFSSDGEHAVTASADGTAGLWTSSGRPLGWLRHGGAVNSASFSEDGRRVVTASDDGTARVWRVPDGKEMKSLRHPAEVLSASISPDGSLVLTTAADRIARIWRIADGKLLHQLRGHRHRRRLIAASFSHDGSKVVTASADETARMWDARTGGLLHTLVGRDALTSAVFSPDDRVVLTTSLDGTARVWSVASGDELYPPLSHPGGGVNGAGFSPDGRWIVTAGPAAAGLWSAATGDRESYLYGGSDDVPLTNVTFSGDGGRILAGDVHGRVWMYRCRICGRLRDLVALAEERLAGTGRRLTQSERNMYLHG